MNVFRAVASALFVCASLSLGGGCFRVESGSGTANIKLAGGEKHGQVETERSPIMYSVMVSVVEQERARRMGFENIMKASLLFVKEDYTRVWRGTAFRSGKLEIETISGTFKADLKSNVIYFVDIKNQKVIPLTGTIREADFEEADALEKKMQSIVALNWEVLNDKR